MPAGLRVAANSKPPAPRSSKTPLTHTAAWGHGMYAGQVACDLVNVETGAVTDLRAAGGRLYARSLTRWAEAGQRVAKIAGTRLARNGKLLSP